MYSPFGYGHNYLTGVLAQVKPLPSQRMFCVFAQPIRAWSTAQRTRRKLAVEGKNKSVERVPVSN